MIRTSGCKHYKKHVNGMTLIELAIVVAIISILATVAYPSYLNHALKSHRMVALGDLSRLQLALESSYDGGYNWNQLISAGQCLVCDSDPDRYAFSIISAASPVYTIKATALSQQGQNQDTCFSGGNVTEITLTSSNIALPEACWK
ncbi:type IV pilin protein [Vibrio sp. CAU 1672]|uniref:type IV pilin protein n=1 Tax=Vibrio sp. CAU 1672 TaxID=3032594 RepID=UPI0023DC5714|nr:type IV pilin protein [Vibrio sp. CAU 1672]MDF2154219.1 type IV pilin protein [Vibrio sp. CAU 1672]